MKHVCERIGPVALLALAAAVMTLPRPAAAFIPQTIIIDGVNDFNASNLLDDDTGDTEIKDWCTNDPQVDAPMDLGKIYVTNDVNNIYIGFEYQRDCFSSPQVNLGIAFSYGNPADGGTTDPFARKIAWNAVINKPDNVFYAVIDAFNYEALYDWNGAGWDNISATVNPGYGSGSDGLGMANDSGFEELALPLSVFAVSPGDTIYLEVWMTQDGTSKPPLDAMGSDDVQTSTPSGTVFDVATPVEMSTLLPYVVQNAVDNNPPLVSLVAHNVDSQIDVTFNEPVDPVTAGDPANYTLSGSGTAASVIAAAVDGSVPSIVHLTLSNDIVAAVDPYRLDVVNVQDLAGNTIVNDGVQNAGCFALKYLLFEGLFGPYLQGNSAPPDTFTVEGSKFPLSFGVCDGAFMTQVDAVNQIWQFGADFSFPVSCADSSGTLTIEWKFNHNCGTWETIGNRSITLDAKSPDGQILSHYWDDLDPTQFTDKDIDVIYTVDMNRFSPVPGVDEVALAGSQLPLGFSAPFLVMVDDGTGQDTVAGDGIYTTTVTFPTGTLKNVEYKFTLNGSFECPQTGNRQVFLDDTLYDTIGGVNGPLVLPLAYYNRCFVIGHDVEVVFKVDASQSSWAGTGGGLDMRLAGSVAPLDWDPALTVAMHDDGVAPDAAAGDDIYSVSVVFPDSSTSFLEFKYAVNGTFEGQGQPNRFVTIDDAFDAVGNPQVLPLHQLHHIVATGVGEIPTGRRTHLLGSWPNPFNPRTTIDYEVGSSGRVSLSIYDARGRRVRALVDEIKTPGRYSVRWEGRNQAGSPVSSGVYYARLLADGSADGRKLVLLK